LAQPLWLGFCFFAPAPLSLNCGNEEHGCALTPLNKDGVARLLYPERKLPFS
jgi:hypothetical protein